MTIAAGAPTHASSTGTGHVERLIGDFLAYMELERGLSRNTLEAYRSDLLQLAAFLHDRHLDVLEVGHAELSAFFAELSGGTGRALRWLPPRSPARWRACAPSTGTCAWTG